MSKYRVIKSEFKTGESLLKALADCGLQCEHGPNLRENNATLKTSWRGGWGGKDQQVSIAVSCHNLERVIDHAMDGMGFVWNGAGYDLVQDQHDLERGDVNAMMNKLRQRYSYHEVMRLAHAHGYNVRETSSQNGQMRVKIVRL